MMMMRPVRSTRREILGSASLLLGAPLLGAEPVAEPEDLGARVARLVAKRVGDGECPGAVVVVGRRDEILLHEAYHLRSVLPTKVPMTKNSIFDLASLTKPVAAATAVFLLREAGRLRLSDPVARHLPGYGVNGKSRITIEQMLLHSSGLVADNPIADYRAGAGKAWENLWNLTPVRRPGTRFVYSDVGYQVLGKVVERLSGQPLDQFTQEKIFTPLGMTDCGYRPAKELRHRMVPTEKRNGQWVLGEVHDPRAYAVGGVSGHAGLFATGQDLALYAQMILRRGTAANGARILAPATVAELGKARSLPGQVRRTAGFDVWSHLSTNRSPSYSASAFGHGGFTGTALWIDPVRNLFVILLASRLHPDGRGTVNTLAAEIGTAAVASLGKP